MGRRNKANGLRAIGLNKGDWLLIEGIPISIRGRGRKVLIRVQRQYLSRIKRLKGPRLLELAEPLKDAG